MWSSLLGGVGAGIAVVGFLAAQWPWGLLAAPGLAAWTLLLSAVSSRRGPQLFVLVGVLAVVLCVAAGGLLATLP